MSLWVALLLKQRQPMLRERVLLSNAKNTCVCICETVFRTHSPFRRSLSQTAIQYTNTEIVLSKLRFQFQSFLQFSCLLICGRRTILCLCFWWWEEREKSDAACSYLLWTSIITWDWCQTRYPRSDPIMHDTLVFEDLSKLFGGLHSDKSRAPYAYMQVGSVVGIARCAGVWCCKHVISAQWEDGACNSRCKSAVIFFLSPFFFLSQPSLCFTFLDEWTHY